MKTEILKRLSITVMRMAIGWVFIYEGLSKIFENNMSIAPFLRNTRGFLSGFYHWLGSPEIIGIVNLLNTSLLLFIGGALFVGLFTRYAALFGVILLSLYYFAYPAFGETLIVQPEGNLFIVNKIFIQASILAVFMFIKENGYGIETGFKSLLKGFNEPHEQTNASKINTRREAIKNLATLPILGVMGLGAFNSRKKYSVDTISGATIRINKDDVSELKGELPKGMIGNHKISRLVLGGNLIEGHAHARDLIYVKYLFKAYNTPVKIYETLMLAEQAGINTINISMPSNLLMKKYKMETGSKIKVISQVEYNRKNPDGDNLVNIKKAIDYGADIIQIQGPTLDHLVRDNRFDVIVKMIEYIRGQGYTAGMGAHTIDSLIECEKRGITPDYYMKTMHHDKYWSAHPIENRVPFEVDDHRNLDHNKFHDNIFCLFPDKTVDFVNRAKIPVMGFKTLAAGAIKPEDGFKWAFENGADFICVGMFDWQIVNDVNVVLDTLNNLSNRNREWFG